MGWASGSKILEDVAKTVMPLVEPKKRARLAKKLIDIFQDSDCDTICDVDQPDIRKAYEKMYPEDD